MGRFLVVLALVAVAGMLSVVVHQLPAAFAESGIETEVRQDMESALDLWRDGRYADLYEQVIPSGKQSKETFVRKMTIATRRPTCCWDKVQDVRVTAKNGTTAMVRAKLGFEEGVETAYITRTFKVVRQGDVWRFNQADIVSLAAGSTRKKYVQKHRSNHAENSR